MIKSPALLTYVSPLFRIMNPLKRKSSKRSTALERSVHVQYFTGGLKPVSRRDNLSLSSDVDQDT